MAMSNLGRPLRDLPTRMTSGSSAFQDTATFSEGLVERLNEAGGLPKKGRAVLEMMEERSVSGGPQITGDTPRIFPPNGRRPKIRLASGDCFGNHGRIAQHLAYLARRPGFAKKVPLSLGTALAPQIVALFNRFYPFTRGGHTKAISQTRNGSNNGHGIFIRR